MLRSLLVLSILVPGFVLALKNRFAALLMYLWFAFFKPQDWMWIDISSLRLSLVFGAVLLVPSVFSGIWPNMTHPLSVGTALFLVTAIVSHFNAPNQEIALYWLDYFGRLTVICLFAVSLMTTPRRVVAVLAVIAGSLGFYTAKAGVASLLVGGARYAEGLTGAFSDNNGYALATVMIIPMLLAVSQNAQLLAGEEWQKYAVWVKRGFLVAVPLSALTVISTFSRGGFVALTAATLVYVALHQRRVRMALAMAVIVALGLAFVPIPEGYLDRLQTLQTYEEEQEESALSRTHFWRVAIEMADAHPLGVGPFNYRFVYDQFDSTYGRYGTKREVHSSHFQVLAEEGWLGFVVWVFQFAVAAWIGLRLRRAARTPGLSEEMATFMRSMSNCLLASMAGFFVGGAFLSAALNDLTWLTFAVFAATDRMIPGLLAATTSKPALATTVRPVAQWRVAVARRLPHSTN